MGEKDTNAGAPAPPVTVERKSGSQIALALTVLALVLASNSIINEKWMTQSQTQSTDFTFEYEQEFGLFDYEFELCVNDDCNDLETKNYGEQYDDCIDSLEGESSSTKEKACGDFADFHNAGFVTMILLILASVILLLATILHVRSMTGSSSRAANLFSGISGVWLGVTLLVWYLMIPEAETEYEWSQGLWMVLISSIIALVAGYSGVLQSWIDGPPRMRARGVRSGTGMSEFVLKESSCGDHSLSILVDSELVRVARVKRVGAIASVDDILATRRDSYTGFSHQRLDWLDDFRGLWWVVCGASLISSFMISNLFLIPFLITAGLVLLQLMDPERFVVSTTSGNHPFYINRWRSNRELTNLAMDLVDDAMIAVLRGEDLDTEKLDARAELIADRFVANREEKRASQAEVEAQKEAMINQMSPSPLPPGLTPPGVDAQPPGPESISPPESTTNPSLSPEPPLPESPPEKETTENEVEMEMAEDSSTDEEDTSEPPTPPVKEELSSKPSPPRAQDSPTVVIPPPPSEIPAPPTGPPPSTTPLPPTGPPSAIPQPPSGPPKATPQPPTGPPKPTPQPPMMQAPVPAAIPPPPSAGGMAAPMPPPPGMGGMPAPMPPPPGMGGIPAPMPPMVDPKPMSPPPPVLVQGAPREENLTDDEKDDLLGDLSD